MITLISFLAGGGAVLSMFAIGIIIAIPGLFLWPLLVLTGGCFVLADQMWTWMTSAYWFWAMTIVIDIILTGYMLKTYRSKDVAQKQRREPQLTV